MHLTFLYQFRLPHFFFEDKSQDAELLGEKSLIFMNCPDFLLVFQKECAISVSTQRRWECPSFLIGPPYLKLLQIW